MFSYYLELALRSLKRNPVLTALMVLAIAVGIGASMTTLSVMHILSGDPLPGRSDHLFHVQVDPVTGMQTGRELPASMDYRSAMDLWQARRAKRQTLVAPTPVKLRVAGSGEPMLARSMLGTTADFFRMFDVPFRYGTPWDEAADRQRGRVVVISADLNNRLFGGDDSVGRMLRLGQTDVRVVGVLKRWRPAPLFYQLWGGHGADGNGAARFYGRPEDVYVPLPTAVAIKKASGQFMPVHFCWRHDQSVQAIIRHEESAPCLWVTMWVDLASPSALSGYRSFLSGYAAKQVSLGRFQHPDTRLRSLMQWLEWNHVVPADVQLQMWTALAFFAICLLNTVGLLLTKFLSRSGEIGVRRAMGASRRAVFAQFMVEAGVIGVAGGIGGWLLTLVGLWVVRQQPVAYADLARLHLPMFLAALALAICASLLAGVFPALRASRISIDHQLKTL